MISLLKSLFKPITRRRFEQLFTLPFFARKRDLKPELTKGPIEVIVEISESPLPFDIMRAQRSFLANIHLLPDWGKVWDTSDEDTLLSMARRNNVTSFRILTFMERICASPALRNTFQESPTNENYFLQLCKVFAPGAYLDTFDSSPEDCWKIPKEAEEKILATPYFREKFERFKKTFIPKESWERTATVEEVFVEKNPELKELRGILCDIFTVFDGVKECEHYGTLYDGSIGYRSIDDVLKNGIGSLKNNSWFQLRTRHEELLQRHGKSNAEVKRLEAEIEKLEVDFFQETETFSESKKEDEKEPEYPIYNYQVQLRTYNSDRASYDFYVFR